MAQFRQPIKRRQKSGSVGSRGGQTSLIFRRRGTLMDDPTTGSSPDLSFIRLVTETAAEFDRRPRPQSSLIRQSSWSGLSESSSHESLTGPLVKSNSLSSMKMASDSKRRPARPHRGLLFLCDIIVSLILLSAPQRSNRVRSPSSVRRGPMAAQTPSPVNPRWDGGTRPRRLRRPLVEFWFSAVRSASPASTKSAWRSPTRSWTSAARPRQTDGQFHLSHRF